MVPILSIGISETNYFDWFQNVLSFKAHNENKNKTGPMLFEILCFEFAILIISGDLIIWELSIVWAHISSSVAVTVNHVSKPQQGLIWHQ